MGTFTDSRDGTVYKTVKIGNQVWMAENLAYEIEGSKCYGEGDKVDVGNKFKDLSDAEIQANCKKYGRLYDWETAIKACPPGWHLPSKEEWQKLVDFANTNKNANNRANRCLKSKGGWEIGGTDDFGFTALSGGYKTDNEFCKIGEYGRWWSSSECDSLWDSTKNESACAYYCSIKNNGENPYWNQEYKRFLFSVRCIKD